MNYLKQFIQLSKYLMMAKRFNSKFNGNKDNIPKIRVIFLAIINLACIAKRRKYSQLRIRFTLVIIGAVVDQYGLAGSIHAGHSHTHSYGDCPPSNIIHHLVLWFIFSHLPPLFSIYLFLKFSVALARSQHVIFLVI